VGESIVDEDIARFSREELVAEIMKLRAAVRQHRDASGHSLCWYSPELWSLLPDQSNSGIAVPEWPQFMRGCIKFRQSLDVEIPEARRTQEEF
jgi:hypothetical protein